jgi:hypothetical protein
VIFCDSYDYDDKKTIGINGANSVDRQTPFGTCRNRFEEVQTSFGTCRNRFEEVQTPFGMCRNHFEEVQTSFGTCRRRFLCRKEVRKEVQEELHESKKSQFGQFLLFLHLEFLK